MSTQDYLVAIDLSQQITETVNTRGWAVILSYLDAQKDIAKDSLMTAVELNEFYRLQARVNAIEELTNELKVIGDAGDDAIKVLRSAGLHIK